MFATIAPLWPAYHLGQIALTVVGMDDARPLWVHFGVLVVVGIAFFVLARGRLARNG